jgi:CheY-like chemotaxis protein
MLVIAENAENKLMQDLKSCWETLPKHRCLHLQISRLPCDQGMNIKLWLEVILNEFRSAVDAQEGTFYVCRDRDLFILTRTLTHKRVEDVLSNLAPKLTPALLSPGLASLFEIGVDWPKLRSICYQKLEAIEIENARKNQKKREELEKVSKEAALRTINPDLIKSLEARRTKREEPLIMIVEDDPFSQKMIGNALKNNYNLSMSNDGAGALMSYVTNAPDVLFLDIGLPDINGHEVLERLFKMDPNAYVVMFSGNGDRENVLKAMQLGAKGFVGKPFTKDKLIAYIEKSPFILAKNNKERTNEYSIN